METKEEVVFIENSVKPEYKSDIKWLDPVEPKPISEFEKNMLKGTLSVSELLEQEKNEKPKEETEEEKEKRIKREYITKVKIIALDKIGKFPLDNPTYFHTREKKKLIQQMEEIMKMSEEEINTLFNTICTEVLFCPESDYTKFPTYNI